MDAVFFDMHVLRFMKKKLQTGKILHQLCLNVD